MPTRPKIERFFEKILFRKSWHQHFLWVQTFSKGIRRFEACSGEFEIYLKMHLKVICQSLQIHRTMIPKTSKIHKFLKILWFSPKGSSEKENEGECFAPCKNIIVFLWFCCFTSYCIIYGSFYFSFYTLKCR